jgi:Domain of unknown function (DUF4136)
MKFRFVSLLMMMMVCLAGQAALAQKVNVDWKRGDDFSKYKTYAWGTSPHPIQDPLWNQRIVGFVDDQMAQKGLTKVDPGANPDLLVVYNAGVKQNVSLEGYRMGWYNAMGSIQQVVENEGTLVVDLADPQQKMVIWRGMASETLSDKSSKNIEKVQKMVRKMFEKYPPKS